MSGKTSSVPTGKFGLVHRPAAREEGALNQQARPGESAAQQTDSSEGIIFQDGRTAQVRAEQPRSPVVPSTSSDSLFATSLGAGIGLPQQQPADSRRSPGAPTPTAAPTLARAWNEVPAVVDAFVDRFRNEVLGLEEQARRAEAPENAGREVEKMVGPCLLRHMSRTAQAIGELALTTDEKLAHLDALIYMARAMVFKSPKREVQTDMLIAIGDSCHMAVREAARQAVHRGLRAPGSGRTAQLYAELLGRLDRAFLDDAAKLRNDRGQLDAVLHRINPQPAQQLQHASRNHRVLPPTPMLNKAMQARINAAVGGESATSATNGEPGACRERFCEAVNAEIAAIERCWPRNHDRKPYYRDLFNVVAHRVLGASVAGGAEEAIDVVLAPAAHGLLVKLFQFYFGMNRSNTAERRQMTVPIQQLALYLPRPPAE